MDNKTKLKLELRKLKLKEKSLKFKFNKLAKEIDNNTFKIIIIESKLKELEENND